MLILLLALLMPLAQQDGPLITSKGPTTIDGDIFRVVNEVIVTYQDMRFEADWVEWNKSTNQLTAGDHVKYVRAGEELQGGKLSFNLGTKTGTILDAKGQLEGFYVNVGEAERLPDGRWSLKKPMFTSCKNECRWRFNLEDALVEPGKSVRGKNTIFRFEGLPVFFLPYVIVPNVNRERSTGFLMPTTSTSTTKGRSISGAFYWAINRSYDATFTSEYFTKRGPTGKIDFRAAPRENSLIDVSTFFAIDRKKQGGQSTRIQAFSDFGQNWRGVADMNIFSSFEFRQVYEDNFNLISSPVEQSIGFITRNQEHSSINVLYNRTAVFYQDQPSVALRKFPSFDFSLPTDSIARKMPVYFSLGSSFTGMARRDGKIDTPPFMQRVDVQPAIDIPLVRSRIVQWSHHLGLRDTIYTHSLNSPFSPEVSRNTLNRASFNYAMRVGGPQIERNFGTWRHIVEPSIEYRYVTGIDRFRQTIIVDETDLITDTNEIEYGITNRFIAGHEFLSWRIAQKLYFDPTFGGALLPGRRNTLQPLMDLSGVSFSDGTPRRFSPLVSTFRIATTPGASTDVQVDYDTVRNDFRSAGIMGGLNRGSLYSSVAYFFNKRDAIQSANNQLRGLIRYGLQDKRGISGEYSFSYDLYRSLLQSSTAQVSYNTECYGLSFEFTRYDFEVRRESRFRFALSLKNLGSIGTLRLPERLF